MPSLGHRIIGLDTLLAQRAAEAATNVPKGTSSPEAEGACGKGP